MVIETVLKDAARKLAGVLHQYALAKGWRYAPYGDFSDGDYFIEIIANSDWLRFDVTFVAKAFRQQDPYVEFKDVQDWIEASLKDDPALPGAVDLVLRSPAEFEATGFSESLGSGHGDVPIDEEVIKSAIPTGKR